MMIKLARIFCHIIISILSAMIITSIFTITDFLSPVLEIFFFRLVFYALIASFIVMIISLVIANSFREALSDVLNIQGIVLVFMVSFLTIYAFLGVTTFTNERSYTIFSLAYLYEVDSVLTQQDMERVFVDMFVYDGGATRFRIDEQLNTGYLEATVYGYILSASGRRFIRLLRFIDIFFPVSTDPSSLYPLGR